MLIGALNIAGLKFYGCCAITLLQKPDNIIIKKGQCGSDGSLCILFKVKVGRKCELWVDGTRINVADKCYKYGNDRIAIELSILRNLKGFCKCTVSCIQIVVHLLVLE